MMRNWVRGVGEKGINRDLAVRNMDPAFWSDGRNVRFSSGRVEAMGGVQVVTPDDTVITDPILNTGVVVGATDSYLLLSTETNMYAYDGFDTFDITRGSGDYDQITTNLFEHMVFNGLTIFNHNNDLPQVWDNNSANNADDLANWDSTWRTKHLRKFGSYLIALNMIEGGTAYEHKIRWSHPAEPGSVPVSWDETDPTYLAGEFTFADTDKGRIMNGLELDNRFFVYKQGSVWVLTQTGQTDVFARDPVLENMGVESERSLVSVPFGPDRRKYHFFQSADGFQLFDGQQPTEVFYDVFLREFKALRDEETYRINSFSVVNLKDSEVWFCFPESGASYPNLALCLDLRQARSSIRELGGASNIAWGLGIGPSGGVKTILVPYSDGTSFSDGTQFSLSTVVPSGPTLVEACPGSGLAYILEAGNLGYDDQHFSSWVTRESLPMVKYDTRDPQATIVDYNRRKLVTQVVPKIASAGNMTMEIGTQEGEREAISWTYSATIPGNFFQTHLGAPVSGRFISFRYTSLPGQTFALDGFDYEVDLLGMF